MKVSQLLQQLKSTPESIEFDQVIAAIDEAYDYTPNGFTNGLGDKKLVNDAGTNEGSCRIFAFAKLNQLNQAETLCCFGKYYREDVLQNPNDDNHANIRRFMADGWAGIRFDGEVLVQK